MHTADQKIYGTFWCRPLLPRTTQNAILYKQTIHSRSQNIACTWDTFPPRGKDKCPFISSAHGTHSICGMQLSPHYSCQTFVYIKRHAMFMLCLLFTCDGHSNMPMHQHNFTVCIKRFPCTSISHCLHTRTKIHVHVCGNYW